jgi:LEM3 (ligand-effect modulator 3) family / CDC50 family
MEYTNCKTAPSTYTEHVSGSIVRWKYNQSSSLCTLEFNVTTQLETQVFMYIRITNFYQNSRLYLKSKDSDQLSGKVYTQASAISTSLTSCGYLTYANCTTASGYTWIGNGMTHAQNNPDCLVTNKSAVITSADEQAQYYPCGLIANSYFSGIHPTNSDDISDLACTGGGCTSNYAFSTTGIAWPEDASKYTKSGWATDATLTSSVPTKVIPPPQWRAAWPEKYANGYTQSTLPDLSQMERFQVWMRVAGLPTFRKLWGKQSQTLPVGTYEISIRDIWNATQFGGTKAIVLSEVGFLGPKNAFLAIELLVVGIFCFLVAIFVLTVRIRKFGDINQLSWNKQKVD